LPSSEERASLQADPRIAAFLRDLAHDGVDRVEDTKAKEVQSSRLPFDTARTRRVGEN
jgi:hypothetical protein